MKMPRLAAMTLLIAALAAACAPAQPQPTRAPTAAEAPTMPAAPTAAPTTAAAEPIYLAIIWHQHQPVYYKDPQTGIYARPWVRLHAAKSYVDMALTVQQYPDVHVTFNLTPSLLRQLRDLEAGAVDAYWVLSEKPAADLTAEDKRFILQRFFDINPKIIELFPRFIELRALREGVGTDEQTDAVAAKWTPQDFLDLQVLFNLGWTDPDFRAEPAIAALVEKGRAFTEQDKAVLLARHQELIARVIPLHAEMQRAGQIEVTMTPYAHPILPLLFSTDEAREALPDASLPNPAFRYGQDGVLQIERGIALYQELFGQAPRGMWPGEGSVSQTIVNPVARSGIVWMASDEEVLARSLGLGQFSRNSAETVQQADQLYRPYYVSGSSGDQVAIIFRDRTISDKVGFTYSGVSGQAAARDFIQRIENIRAQLSGTPGPHLVSVILDGENAWEHYPNDGKEFLNTLYQLLSESQTIRTVTPSEYLAQYPEQPAIEDLWAGSWISADFATWIGEDEENKAWALLADARATLQKYLNGTRTIAPEKLARAQDLMLIAQGSDWFWWYGSDQNSGNDDAFDQQFRDTLIEMYTVLGAEVPVKLYVPIIAAQPARPNTAAQGLLTVTVDGTAAAGEWDAAGRYDAVGGVAQRADDLAGTLYYGFDAQNLYLRLDARGTWADLGADGLLGVYIGTTKVSENTPFSRFGSGGKTLLGFDAAYVAELRLNNGALAGEATLTAVQDGAWLPEPQAPLAAGVSAQTIELAVPLAQLAEFEAGDAIDLRLVVSRAGADIQLLPTDSLAAVGVPDLGLSTTLLAVTDPQGDDNGPGGYTYPTDAVFQAGVFDLTEFVVAEDENNLIFKLAVAGGIENVWGSPRGVSVQTFDIYIDTGAGTARTLFPGRNAAIAAGGWDYGLWIEGWEGGLYQASADGPPEEVAGVQFRTIVDGPNGRVTIRLPKSALPAGDPSTWRYAAMVLGQEGFPSSGVWRVRDIAPAAQQWRFGGSLDGTNAPRIIDLALPDDAGVSQADALTPPTTLTEPNADLFQPDDLAQIPMLTVP